VGVAVEADGVSENGTRVYCSASASLSVGSNISARNGAQGVAARFGSRITSGGNIDARIDGATDDPNDAEILGGSIVSCNNFLGGANISKNTLTSNGIIWG